ncbi:MAG: DUF4860 domain-containing protein [Clostridia bacterium]|nr:DUF4860 domain-containing protein [Clostridia bacterium]
MNKRGYSGIEVVLVMILLFAVSFLVFSTVTAGSKAYFNLSESQGRDADLRVGMSFLDVKLRKNDVADSVRVRANPFGEGEAVCIRSAVDGRSFDTWIYCLDGGLYELFLQADTAPTHDLAVRITGTDRMEIRLESDGLLRIELALDDPEGGTDGIRLAGTFYLKTGVA